MVKNKEEKPWPSRGRPKQKRKPERGLPVPGETLWCFSPQRCPSRRAKSDKAEATMEGGVLTLTIPKAEEVKPKVIKVQDREKK